MGVVTTGTVLDDTITTPAPQPLAVGSAGPVTSLRGVTLGADLITVVEGNGRAVDQLQVSQIFVPVASGAAQRSGMFDANIQM